MQPRSQKFLRHCSNQHISLSMYLFIYLSITIILIINVDGNVPWQIPIKTKKKNSIFLLGFGTAQSFLWGWHRTFQVNLIKQDLTQLHCSRILRIWPWWSHACNPFKFLSLSTADLIIFSCQHRLIALEKWMNESEWAVMVTKQSK